MSGADGVVAVEVKLGTKNFEQQIKQVENELTSLQKKEEFLLEINEKMNKSHARQFTISAKTLQKMQELGLTMEDIGNADAFSKLQTQIEKTNNTLTTLNEKQKELNNQGFDNVKNTMQKVNQSTESIIKKVAKWGLAVFGVRSAYMFVRQAISTLSQYDEKLGADIQYIRFALASALKPIIETIINLVYKLLAYINYIAQAWFRVNLFANATVKAFKKVNTGVKDTNKSAKQLQKTLAGFDEMNILQDTGSTSTGGGGGGIATPSMDLSSLKDVEIPGWVEWIATHKDTIIEGLKQIGALIVTAFAIKGLLDFTDGVDKVSKILEKLGGLKIFGIIGGIAITLYSIIDFINSITEGTITLFSALTDLGGVLTGVGLAMVALNAANPYGWMVLVGGVLTTLIGAFGDTSDEIISVEDATRNLEDAQRGVNEAYQEYTNASKTHLNAYKNYEKAQKNLTETAKKLKISEDKLKGIGEELFEGIRNGTIDIEHLGEGEDALTKKYGLSEEQLLSIYEVYVDVKDGKARLETATDKLTTSEEKLTEAQKKEIQEQLTQQEAVANTTKNFDEYRDAVIDAYEKGAISGEEAQTRLLGVLNFIDKESKQTFVDGIPGYIQEGMKDAEWYFDTAGIEWRDTTDDIKIYTDSLAGKFNSKFGKDIPNSVQKSIDKVKSLTDKLSKLPFGKSFSIKISSSLSGSGNAKGAIYFPPKLAVGGIINQPGRGVPLAMGGERGAEGVIPLTDAQQMQRLGEAIGKYITVNLSNVVKMNSRVISREMKQVENEENFAFNGG